MRVVLDAGALNGERSGIGRYVEGLVGGLLALPDPPQLALADFSLRGNRPDVGVPWVGPRLPARSLGLAWRHTGLPKAEWLVGRCELFHAPNYVLPPLARARGVVTVSDLTFLLHADTVTPGVRRYRELVPRSVARAAAVITLSATVKAEIVDHLGVPPDRVHVVPLGVGPEWAATARPSTAELAVLGLPAQYLLFVGSVEPRKDLPTLLAALRELPGAPPLVLAGPAGWGPPLAAAGSVIGLGFVDDAVLRRVVAGAAALVLPSRYEGFGLPPLEALACGTPVVASDLPVLREVLGGHASYATPGDPVAFAAALQQVLSDNGDNAGEPARQARRAHAAGWTWARCAARTVEVYVQVGGPA